ncbi:MAG: hypothetical protein AB7Q37_14295 [Pyrinomonadaceae bacterium]
MSVPGLKLPALLLLMILAGSAAAQAQSTTQDFPTPVLTNEISGTIKPRTIGDSRLTTHYYTFNGDQGDVFINLVTRNLTGDFDVFTLNGLRPVTKIAVYADYGENETGRVVYLRKKEKLILRVQGRTPNDEEAVYRIKFAGSFVAIRPEDVQAAPEMPRVAAETKRDEKVAETERSSVPTADPAKEKEAEEKTEEAKTPPERTDEKKIEEEVKKSGEAETKEAVPEKKAEVVITDPLAAKPDDPAARREEKKPEKPETEKEVKEPEAAPPATARRRTRRTTRTPPVRTPPEPKPDPLASINLMIQLKDGNALEFKMSEIRRFSVDRGILVVTLKTGKISRYPLAKVSKVTIE